MAKTPTKPTRPGIVRRSAAKAANKAHQAAVTTSKQDMVLGLLRRANGASIDEIIAVTDWQPQSARGFLSGAAARHRRHQQAFGEDGVRRYHVAPRES